MAVVLHHAVGIDTQPGFAFTLFLEVGEYVHAGRIPPKEEGFVCLLGALEIIQ